MLRWKEWDHDRCPRCGSPEDSSHVWICSGSQANVVWDTALRELRTWLESVQTYPPLIDLIIRNLTEWRTDDQAPTDTPRELLELVRLQSHVGWRRFFEGWLVQDWQLLQQQHYSALHSRRSGRRWVIALIKKLWEVAWNLWEHRNGVLHNAEQRPAVRDIRRLDREIIRAFRHLSDLLLSSNDVHLVHLPLTDLLKKELLYKQEWLRIANLAISSARYSRWQVSTSSSRMLSGMRRAMRAWFLLILIPSSTGTCSGSCYGFVFLVSCY